MLYVLVCASVFLTAFLTHPPSLNDGRIRLRVEPTTETGVPFRIAIVVGVACLKHLVNFEASWVSQLVDVPASTGLHNSLLFNHVLAQEDGVYVSQCGRCHKSKLGNTIG